MPAEHEMTPMGTPVPAGECPSCGAFLWMRLRPRPPRAPMVGPVGQPTPCSSCPKCHASLWLEIASGPPVATPHDGTALALVPRDGDPKQRTTRRIRPS